MPTVQIPDDKVVPFVRVHDFTKRHIFGKKRLWKEKRLLSKFQYITNITLGLYEWCALSVTSS
jgi:hypothetical protein